MSESLWPHVLQHTRLPCSSPSPGAYLNSCPLSWWCHPTISSSVFPFSSGLQPFPASGSFQMSHLFTSGGQSIGVSASASVLSMNIQNWFSLQWTGWISLQSKGTLKSLPRLSHKRSDFCVSFNEVDERRIYYTEWHKSEREKQISYINTYIWSLDEKVMAPHSSTLAWRIPWTEEPGGLQSMGLHRVGHK